MDRSVECSCNKKAVGKGGLATASNGLHERIRQGNGAEAITTVLCNVERGACGVQGNAAGLVKGGKGAHAILAPCCAAPSQCRHGRGGDRHAADAVVSAARAATPPVCHVQHPTEGVQGAGSGHVELRQQAIGVVRKPSCTPSQGGQAASGKGNAANSVPLVLQNVASDTNAVRGNVHGKVQSRIRPGAVSLPRKAATCDR